MKNSSTNENWAIIENMIKKEGIASHHLNSYNEFLDHGIQEIIDEVGGIDVETTGTPYRVTFGKIYVGEPRSVELDGSTSRILPLETRLRDLAYSAPIHLEMTVEENGIARETKKHHIGDIPIMIRSAKCETSKMAEKQMIEKGEDPFDPGGYFIVNGSERIVVGLEDLSPNKIIVEQDKVGGNKVFRSKIYSSIVGYRAKLELTLKPDGAIMVKLPSSPVDLPVVTLIRALGIENDREIASLISNQPEMHNLLEITFEKAVLDRDTACNICTVCRLKILTKPKDQTQEEFDKENPEYENCGHNEVCGKIGDCSHKALIYIGNRVAHGMLDEFRIRKAESILDWGLLPHLGKNLENRYDKAIFIGEAVCKLLELRMGWINQDDKDHYGNKIVKFAGPMIADLFRTAFRNLIRDMKYQLERTSHRKGSNIVGASIRPGIITDKLANAVATGNWGRGKVGVTQLLDRTNYLSLVSHLRRIQSPLSRTQPNFEARDLHSTHYGRICPSETPEGANCGLVKNIALSSVISVSSSFDDILEKLSQIGIVDSRDISMEDRSRFCKIFVDGRLVGYTKDETKLVTEFRNMRRQGQIHSHASINLQKYPNKNASTRIHISLSSGRVLRPLIVVSNGKPLVNHDVVSRTQNGELSWQDLIQMGVVDLLDANEEENALVAIDGTTEFSNTHTHVELFSSSILGAAASLIPYAEHNQSPRNTYQSAMSKQSLGFPTPNYNYNTTVREHLLVYPQNQLVKTRATSLLNIDKRPTGQNCVVAVMSYEGYNIEDAIVMNKSSVQRGLARSFFYRLYDAEAKQYLGGMKDNFEIPNADDNTRGFRGEKYYRLLESDGIIMHESVVSGGDVIVGRTSPPRFMEEYKSFDMQGPYRRDTSIAVRPSEFGVVDSVFMTQNEDGEKLYKIRVRDMRVPEIGDKFASRHGQKGIVGLLVNQEDMPYSESGIVPDIIINPHAFPSRMTVGQFIESIGGKAASFRGTPVDGSTFAGENAEDLGLELEKYGFKSSGSEIMYDGKTGKKLKVEIFIGVVYYQKLHHMVADKMHARARGQVQMLTKQPTEGRARGGGLRFGEMERDCLIAYGASMVLKDRLLDESDKTNVNVCDHCGLLAYYDGQQRKYTCKIDGEDAQISSVTIAYAFKLLLQEMMSLNIAPRLLLVDKV